MAGALAPPSKSRAAIQFNRQELAGAFGDIGTDLPLIIAMILAADLHTASVLIVFGGMQVLSGWVYRMPMPVQPLKAMAALVISQKLAASLLMGAGLAIGIVMLFLALSGLLSRFAALVPKAVTRGVQFGLGLKLALLAFKEYIPALGTKGYILAGAAFFLIVLFLGHKKYPASLLVIALGLGFSLLFEVSPSVLYDAFGWNLPQWQSPKLADIWLGFVLLALPQIPLSLGNSIVATQQLTEDLFPDRPAVSIRKIGTTYGLMNLVIPFLGGIPSCHGSGGMMGHYTFGGRSGGSVILYGAFYLVLGFFFADGFEQLVRIFPLPILGMILLFEGLALLLLIKDVSSQPKDFLIALLVGILAAAAPYGFVLGMLAGLVLYYGPFKLDLSK